MKRYLVLVGVAFVFLSCAKTIDIKTSTDDFATRSFYAYTPANESKVYVDGDYDIRWTADDRISVFCSAINIKYRFKGKTGGTVGIFENMEQPATPTYDRNYAVYPYLEGTANSTEGVITFSLPGMQRYDENTPLPSGDELTGLTENYSEKEETKIAITQRSSFGPEANTMIAVTKDISDTTFKFKNVCGYLMLKIYGGDKIKSITLRGNNNEKIAGEATISAEYEQDPSVVMGTNASSVITLICPDEGVPTQESRKEYTPFWIVVPPTTFTKGFTIDVVNTDNVVVTQSTDKCVTIERNQVVKMAPFMTRIPDVRVEKIWDHDYSAFTSIIYFNGKYYISFREGKSHIFDEQGNAFGKARILVSTNGEEWESLALLEKEGYDLRDPKLSITPDGKLMVIMGGSIYQNRVLVKRIPQVSFSENGTDFSAPQPVKFEGMDEPLDGEWIWRVTWYKGIGYGVTYGNHYTLLKTLDGITYSPVCDLDIDSKYFPNETTVRFTPEGKMLLMARCEYLDRSGRWGVSEYPYTNWTWTLMGYFLGGPDFIILKNGAIFAGTRYNGGSTVLMRGNIDGKFNVKYTLPSDGDTSYPGFLETEKELWMTYYSCHETGNRACIYLAKFRKDYILGL